ncbi:MAG TPA: hypothetical protein PLK37_11880 [Terricaulis sp.]|nr:hypothetical protein [Terricaulis sp.]
MHDDLSLAALLGEAPKTPDPAFRFDVFARVSAHERRSAAHGRAMLQVAVFTAIGAVLALVQTAGAEAGAWAPMLGATGALAVTGIIAFTLIAGPKAALARAASVFRAA